MKTTTIRESAESTSRTLISVVYYVNLLLCIIALISGAIIFIDEVWLGLVVIISSIVLILSITLIRALFDTFINISEKLNYTKHILTELEKIETSVKNLNNTQPIPTKDIAKSTDTAKQPTTPQPIPKPKTKEEIDLENTILEEIIAGNDIHARHLLMQKKGLSLNAAIEYINKIKAEM